MSIRNEILLHISDVTSTVGLVSTVHNPDYATEELATFCNFGYQKALLWHPHSVLEPVSMQKNKVLNRV